jgi:hypothetical protein
MRRHRPCNANAGRTTHSEREVENKPPPSVTGSLLERLQIAGGIARGLRRQQAILERKIGGAVAGLIFASRSQNNCASEPEPREPASVYCVASILREVIVARKAHRG